MSIFTPFEDEDIIPGQVNTVSSGMWSGGVGTLTAFHTSSTQSGSTGEHYYDVYNGVVGTNATASIQFSVTYGHFNGSGSLTGNSNYKASKAIYRHDKKSKAASRCINAVASAIQPELLSCTQPRTPRKQ